MRSLIPLILVVVNCTFAARIIYNETATLPRSISPNPVSQTGLESLTNRANDIDVAKLVIRGSPLKTPQVSGPKAQKTKSRRSDRQRVTEAAKNTGGEGFSHPVPGRSVSQSQQVENLPTSSDRTQNLETEQQQKLVTQWNQHNSIVKQQRAQAEAYLKKYLPSAQQKHTSSLFSPSPENEPSMLSQPDSPISKSLASHSGDPQSQRLKDSLPPSPSSKSPANQAGRPRPQTLVNSASRPEKSKPAARFVPEGQSSTTASSSTVGATKDQRIQMQHESLALNNLLLPGTPAKVNQNAIHYGNAPFLMAEYKQWLAETQSRVGTLKKFAQTQQGQGADQEDLRRKKADNKATRLVADQSRAKVLQAVRDNHFRPSDKTSKMYDEAESAGLRSIISDRMWMQQHALAFKRASREHRFNDALKHEKTFARTQLRTQLRMAKHHKLNADYNYKVACAKGQPNSPGTIDICRKYQNEAKEQYDIASSQYQQTIEAFSGSDSEEEME